MRIQFLKLISSVLMLLLVCLSFLDERQVFAQRVGEPKGVVVFCVSSAGPTETSMEPILIIDDGKYANPVAGDADASALSEFAAKFYASGQKYRLLFGGGDAGSLTVEKSTMDSDCFRAGASIKLKAPATVKLNRNVMALATNSNGLGRTQISRRAPTPSERAEGMRLAKQAFKEKGASTALLSTLEAVNLTAMDLDADGKTELIGTFVLKKTKGGAERHVVFLIAELQGQGYRTALSNYERFTTKDIMSGGSLNSIGAEGIYTERLVDQVDLDADGTGEVFTITNSFEGVTYKMYKKQSGMWKSVYEFNSYRCGF